MPKSKEAIQGPQPLKVWRDWSAGLGHVVDDGVTPGFYTATAMLGDVGDLRPAPVKTDVDITGVDDFDPAERAYKFFEEPVTLGKTGTAGVSYLYTINGDDTADHRSVLKIDMRNATFGTPLEVGIDLGTGLGLGAAARYQGNWYIGVHADDGDGGMRKLTVIAEGAGDTWTNSASASAGSNDLVNLNFQLASSSFTDGVRLLKLDGDPQTAADWGSYFEAGDVQERPSALSAIHGLVFALNRRGLYSFNAQGRSGAILEGFHGWANPFANIQMPLWEGGLIIPMPAGLLHYTIGRAPKGIGIDTKLSGGSPPPGPTELHGGLYQGVDVGGDHLYVLYQPQDGVAASKILVGYPHTKHGMVWNSIADLSLITTATGKQHGVFVAKTGYPNTAESPTPSLWFSDSSVADEHMSYVVLNQQAGPFRTRADTHKITLSGDTYMSEILFPTLVDLSHIVIYTQDLGSGDKVQLSGIVDSSSIDTNFSGPIIASGRHVRVINRKDVHRLMLHVGWTATSTSARVPPTIKRIELWGFEKT